MDIFADPVLLARLQFAATAAYHFIFVPLTIGLGLILAINETRYYRSRDPKDAAATKFWVKIFTATFVLGVATGITMEFSFGTNWADYSRFVGDIFGAPLAAEALLAFFLESTFLGILIFGRKRVSPKFYLVSAWLVWFGSALSALWILIANSWMQTPAGAELAADGSKAVITDFLAAAFNPSLLARYSHTVTALLIMGAFVAMAVSAWYLIKNRHTDFAMKTMKIGAVVGIVTTVVMLGTAHSSAVVVSEEQPTKLAMMEGMYDSEVPPLYAFGWVDEESQEVITPFAIPGGTSFLATGAWDTEFKGLNELAQTEEYGALDPETAPVNFVFQTYHLMVALFGLIAITVILALVFTVRGGKIKNMKWLQRLVLISPVFPLLAIQAGWFTAEVGRQPWVVYPSATSPEGVNLLVNNGVSQSVSSVELVITLVLFLVVYAFLMIAWARTMGRFIKEGPVEDTAPVAIDAGAGIDAKGSAAVPPVDGDLAKEGE
ncbi:cytochrome ubiquinol oxidase subunit I [Eggerthella sp. YY7918]|uniref:cytochrome ubiquinol oxidase subunit I n=1 Tax=Eggerthella sp. (strain YY7918) TaxID=502558 RepID=UPI0002170EA3|nr:cytochrome ubiquinol oxidase subunit I [Eggerthella sp. YY7918]BAK43589.1 cytochrome bd-type quinol oxidase, subunit 1 [Eggerthella sp. YY7918]